MLKLEVKKPRKFISPLLSKKSITTNELTQFQEATLHYLDELEKQRISNQSEPNIVSNVLQPFFKQLGYVANSYSQKGQSGIDLALMLDHSPAVIIEAKAVDSSAMISKHDINKKALHEAILYFMRERAKGNDRLYHIIITDFYRWFVFDAKDFDRLFWKNQEIKKIFKSVQDPSVLGDRTEDFYRMVSEKIADMMSDLINDQILECAYFDLRDNRSEKEFIALYKLLSKDALLKEFNPNDANTLNRTFYSELLYILGLEEQSSGGKKLISRAKNPHTASLYENIARNLKLAGHSQEFETILRLMIIWINRILFLKLLESQLIKWNEDSKYRFLNIQTINDFDKMKIFFFDILANSPHDRAHQEFSHIPYLNSSLFEMNEIEKKYIDISSLEDNCELPYYSKTVLKDAHAKRKEGDVNMLHYLFEFLDAYDFSSEGSEELVSESKSLINASVLGLIFEKLNGYKDGSFYTPSFITMYMSKETITKAIIEKFNQAKGWSCRTLDELGKKIKNDEEANAIIDSLTICDPAVGSGHFLVSSLNVILEIKSQLRILLDAEGKPIKYHELSVENDELIVRDDEGEIFEYKRGSKEKTRIQKMLFLEKQKIIENSLFGVDINPNSAHITRLRLWIELLKNSYYAEDTNLVTMPNIDINIKVGNSLISRYGLDDEIDIPNIKHAIERYKLSVKEYKEGNFLSSKEDIRTAIDDVKGMFGLTLKAQWTQTQEYKKLLEKFVKAHGLYALPRDRVLDALDYNLDRLGGSQTSMFEEEETLTKAKEKEKTKLLRDIEKAAKEIEEIEKGKIYEDAFEWRFEFPEVLDEEGNFIGFDVIIGNPPYGIDLIGKEWLKNKYKETSFGEINSYKFFIQRAVEILGRDKILGYIVPDSYLEKEYFKDVRSYINNNFEILTNIKLGDNIFDGVNMPTAIMILNKKGLKARIFNFLDISDNNNKQLGLESRDFATDIPNYDTTFIIKSSIIKDNNCKALIEIYDQVMGVKVYQKGKGKPKQTEYEKKNDLFVSKQKFDMCNYPYISQGIERYYYNDQKEYIKYGEWLAEPRKKIYFDSKKIVIREVVNPRIYATYIEKPAVVKNIAAVVIEKYNDYSIKYLLTLINSKLFTFYINEQSSKSSNKSYPSLNSKLIKNLPIKNISKEEQKFFIKKANIMLELNEVFRAKQYSFHKRISDDFHLDKLSKKLEYFYEYNFNTFFSELQKKKITLNPEEQKEWKEYFETLHKELLELQAKISVTNNKIDQMVYELYGLSDEEIAMVEGKDTFTKAAPKGIHFDKASVPKS